MKRSLLALGLFPFALAACTTNDPGFGGEPTGPDASAHLVVRIEEAGGFVPAEYTFTRQPTIVIMSDGRIYTTPPQIEIYPSPIAVSYEVREVTADGVEAIIDRAIEAGLTEDGTKGPDENGAQVADASTTVFTFVDRDGTEHVVSAYALGFDVGTETPERQALAEFRDDLGDLDSWMPDGSVSADSEVVAAETLRVGVNAYTGDEALPQDERTWPLSTSLDAFGEARSEGIVDRCGTLAGNDLATFLEAAAGANVLTPWTSDGQRYALLLDPLTPDETASCEPEEYPGGL
jgi:hypothetical protein